MYMGYKVDAAEYSVRLNIMWKEIVYKVCR